MNYKKLASKNIIEKTLIALKGNGITGFFAENGEEAKRKVLEIIPNGAEVMTMTSETLKVLGLTHEIDELGRYNSVRKKLSSMDSKTEKSEKRMLGAAPQVAIGSVHAVTEDGKVIVASATGSQLPAYAYGAEKVVWVVGAQKIVKNYEEGFKRIREHSLPLENERAQKIYGVGSQVGKILILEKEPKEGRVNIIIVNEVLGF